MKLYLYSDFITAAWAKNPQHWREITSKDSTPVRCAHAGVECPPHYHKPNGHLAFDAIERMPTMRDFIKALSP